MNKNNCNYSIDSIKFNKNKIKIDGWIYSLSSKEEIESISILYKDGTKNIGCGKLSKNSQDVENIFGTISENSRFEIYLDYPSSNFIYNIFHSKLEFNFKSGLLINISIIENKNDYIDKFLPKNNEIKVGVGITTFNRFNILIETIKKIKINSVCNVDIVVCDDGSDDETNKITTLYGDISYISGENRGIAWNKNRALYYLHSIKKCDIIILIEDDVFPSEYGWDLDWSLSSIIYGHINYSPLWLRGEVYGTGQWYKPYVSKLLSGQCSAFSSYALSFVGFLDTRFKRYGHEHVEHTFRMIRAGFGGKYSPGNKKNCDFFSINGGLNTVESISTFSEDSVKENSTIFDAIWNESIYRMAWRNDEEMTILKSEIDNMYIGNN